MTTLTELAAEIVSAHATTTSLTTEELLLEIQKVYATLQALETGTPVAAEAAEEVKPAMAVKDAFKKNEVICLLCGKGGMKTLTRHLTQIHNISPKEYKKQFGIPAKQSLTAKSFSDKRKQFAAEKNLAANLAKAREKRMANIAEKKAKAAKAAKKPVAKAKA